MVDGEEYRRLVELRGLFASPGWVFVDEFLSEREGDSVEDLVHADAAAGDPLPECEAQRLRGWIEALRWVRSLPVRVEEDLFVIESSGGVV